MYYDHGVFWWIPCTMNLIIVKYLLIFVLIVFGIQTVFVNCDKPVCSENQDANKQWANNKKKIFIVFILCFMLVRFIFISTLDGKLTALNTADGGTEAWEISTEPGALLSSSIDQLEVNC